MKKVFTLLLVVFVKKKVQRLVLKKCSTRYQH
jgi:hypothetical protein